MSTQGEFSKLRSYLWPVHAYELKKFIPMLIIFFCISFAYTIYRDLKDTMIVTQGSAAAIPFLKLWCVVPSAILLLLVFAKLSNRLGKEALFYAMTVPFLVFFALFAFVMFPAQEYLHPKESVVFLQNLLPQSAAVEGILAIYSNWTFGLFYVLAELWGSMLLSLMFWGFANDITKSTEAKRFYGMLGIGANIALLFSGKAIVWAAPGSSVRPFQESLQVLILMTTIAGIVLLAVYSWMQRNVLTDPRFYDPSQLKKRKEKTKLGIKDSIKYLSKSKYLRNIAIIVLAYGLSMNLVEVVWKGQLKLMYPDPSDYANFMGNFSFYTGLATLFMMFFVSHNVIRRFGWTVAASVTPVVLMITGVCFLSFVVFKDNFTAVLAGIGTTPLAMAVFFGAAQNILSKSSKYSLFDPTKEMAYIPLDAESKTKGKGAIDVVGARLGKSGGSAVQQILFLFVPTVTAMAPFVAIVFVFVIFAWLSAAKALGHEHSKLVQEEPVEDKETVAKSATIARQQT